MSKGSYTVYKPQRPNSKVNSWKSCTCSLLIFAVISLIIILVAWPLKKTNEVEIFTGESAKVSRYTESVETFPVKNESTGKFAKLISSTTASFEEAHTSTEGFKNKDVINIKSAYSSNKYEDTTTGLQERHGKFDTIPKSIGSNASTDQPEKEENTVTEVHQNIFTTSMKNLPLDDNKTEPTDQLLIYQNTITKVYQKAFSTMRNLPFNDTKTEPTDQPVLDEHTVTEVHYNAFNTSMKNWPFNYTKTEPTDQLVIDENTVAKVHQKAFSTSIKNLPFNDMKTESTNQPMIDENSVTKVNQNAFNSSIKNLPFNDTKTGPTDQPVIDENTVTKVHQNAFNPSMQNLPFNDTKTEPTDQPVLDEHTVTEVHHNSFNSSIKNLPLNDTKTEPTDHPVIDENTVTKGNQNAFNLSMQNLPFNDTKTEPTDQPVLDGHTVIEVHYNAFNTSMKNLHFNDTKTEPTDQLVIDENTVTKEHQNDFNTSIKNLPFNDTKIEPTNQPMIDENNYNNVTIVHQNAFNISIKNLPFNNTNSEPTDQPVIDEHTSKMSLTSQTKLTGQNESGKFTVTEVYQYALSHNNDRSVNMGLNLSDNTTIKIDRLEKEADIVTEQYQSIERSIEKSQNILSASTQTQPAYKATTDISQRETFDNSLYSSKESYSKNNYTVIRACQNTISDIEICDTNTCKNIGSKVLTLMKHEENICNNFYNYACGGISKDFLANTESSSDLWNRLKYSLDDANENSPDYLVTFKNYFLSCMGYDFWNELPGNILEDVGTFYGSSDDFNDAPTLTMLLTTLLTKNYAALFDVKMDIDKNSKKLGLVILPVFNDEKPASVSGNTEYKDLCLEKSNIEQGKVNLNDVYSSYKICQLDKSFYISNVRQALLAFNAFHTCNETNKVIEIQHLLFTLEEHILNSLNQSMQPLVMEQNKMFKSKSSSNLSLHTLKLRLPQIKWDYLFTKLFGNVLPADVNIQIYFVNYLSKLLKTLINVNKRELHNSILAMYAHKLYKDYVLDQRDICDKSLHCLKLSSKHMPDISSALYLETFKVNEVEEMDKTAKDIFKHLKKSLLSEIQNGNWLSKEDPENVAYDKIYDLNLISVGDLMPWKDKYNLVKRFKEVNIKSDCFIENTNILEQRNRKLLYSTLGSDPMLPENLWTLLSLPYDTKLSNIIPLNTIVLPLGAMTHYLDNPGSPKFVSMAGLGFTLAKQMNYLLELSGIPILRKIDVQPHNILFKLNQTIDGRTLTVDLNPNESITEIVTDVAGAKLAYLAYKKHSSKNDLPLIWTNMTTAQSYFLMLAQQFCTKKSILINHLGLFEGTELPSMFAVNSIAVNTGEFFEAYNNCSPETNMTAGIRIPLVSSTFTTEKIYTMDTTK